MDLDRRKLLEALAAAGALGLTTASGLANAAVTKPFIPPLGARARVIYINDLSGDPDGLFATVHAILSPSTDLRAIIGAKAQSSGETTDKSVEVGREILRLMGREGRIPVLAGAAQKLANARQPQRSPGVQAIIDEARRTDSQLPLYVTVGGGLTEVASALLLAPDIAERLTLVWIGGGDFFGGRPEYNTGIDLLATQHVFNETKVPIWHVPSDAYTTCEVSLSELATRVAPHGAIGAWLNAKLAAASGKGPGQVPFNTGETWVLGDNPLVLLTALTSWIPSEFGSGRMKFERTGGSRYDEAFAPRVTDEGRYAPNSQGRKVRSYRVLDTRLMFDDFFAKLKLNFPDRT